MGNPKGLEWNQQQLKIAAAINQYQDIKQVVANLGCSIGAVYKVQTAILAGDLPPSLDPEYIEQAKAPMIIGGKQTTDIAEAKDVVIPPVAATDAPKDLSLLTQAAAKALTEKPAQKSGASQPPKTPTKSGLPLTQSASLTAYLQLVPQIQQLPMTPDIFMSFICALKNGYEGLLGDWISLCCRDFWFGRNRDFYAEVSGIGQKSQEKKQEVPVGDGKG